MTQGAALSPCAEIIVLFYPVSLDSTAFAHTPQISAQTVHVRVWFMKISRTLAKFIIICVNTGTWIKRERATEQSTNTSFEASKKRKNPEKPWVASGCLSCGSIAITRRNLPPKKGSKSNAPSCMLSTFRNFWCLHGMFGWGWFSRWVCCCPDLRFCWTS